MAATQKSSPGSARRPIAALGLLLAMTAGCVRQTTDGGEEVFQYQVWVPVAVLVAGIAAAPIGWFWRQRSKRLGWGLLILGPVAALAFAPSVYLERTAVDGEGFHIRSGIWGATAVYDLNFSQIQSLRYISELRSTRRGKRTEYYLVCGLASGGETKVPFNNSVKRAAMPTIVRRATERGISFVDET